MARKGTRLSILAKLANTWSEDDRTGKSRHATSSVNNTGTGEIDVAVPPVQRVAQLGQEATTPGPCTEERIVNSSTEQAPNYEGLKPPTLSHRTCRNGRCGVHEGHHVEEERSGCARIGEIATIEPRTGPSALPQEDPVTGTDECAASGLV